MMPSMKEVLMASRARSLPVSDLLAGRVLTVPYVHGGLVATLPTDRGNSIATVRGELAFTVKHEVSMFSGSGTFLSTFPEVANRRD